MNKFPIKRGNRLVMLVALSLGILTTGTPLHAIGAEPSRLVPKAICGPQDRTESVQGQTTLAERFAPGPAKAYNCNLESVGRFEGEGSAGYLTVFEDCVYYSTWENAGMRHPGGRYLTCQTLDIPR